MSVFAPEKFGRYTLVEKIATGGMAEVFKAKSYGVEGFEKLLVIKRILPHLGCNPKFVTMFINEAKISVSLNHSNIGQVYHLGREGADYFMSMEYIHGRDLTRVLREARNQGRTIPITLAVYIASEVARGLDFAHRTPDSAGNPLRIIHRDISPHNVLLSFEGDVKIVDFGIAQLASELDQNEQKTRMAGKAAYMAPEQAMGQSIDTRSDLFSLGSVLYELLTGQRLYQGQNVNEKLEQARKAEFNPPRNLRADIPADLERILFKLLAREPAQRHQSAAELHDDLTEFLFERRKKVTAHDIRAFMRELFMEELAQEATSRKIRAAVGSMDRLGRAGQTIHHTMHSQDFDSAGSFSGEHRSLSNASDRAMRPLEQALEGNIRRTVISMMIEVHGLTPLSLSLSENRYLELTLRLLKEVSREAEAYGGKFDRFVNDRIWLIWGLYRASEHDLERAITCARELISLPQAKMGVKLGLSIALHRGPVLLGAGFSFALQEGEDENIMASGGYTPMGDTFRLPERILVDSPAASISVSEVIASVLGEDYHLESQEMISVPWLKESVQTYRVSGEKSARERIPKALPEQGDRWFSRQDEVEICRRAMRQLKGGDGGLLHLIGEAGIGKTRFIKELYRLSKRKGIGWFSGSCLYRDRERPLAVFRQMLAAGCAIERRDSIEVQREKVQRLLELGLSAVDVQFIAALLGIEAFQVEDITERRQGVLRAIRRLLTGLGESRPTVIAIENIQWLDPVAREFMEGVMPTFVDLPLLILVSHRPDFDIPWNVNADKRLDLHLQSLSSEGVEGLISALLQVDSIPDALVKALNLRSDGNPLHIEQLVKLLQESGRLKIEGGQVLQAPLSREEVIPLTLQGLVEERISALEPADRKVLQVAAVCGRKADLSVLARVANLQPTETSPFEALIKKGLVVVDENAGTLRFETHLIWQLTYQSISGAERQDTHRRVANALRHAYAEADDIYAEELYHHFLEGGRSLQAARYAEKAADRYQAEYFVSKALDFYQRAIELLGEQEVASGELVVMRDLGRLYVKLGRLQEMMADRVSAENSLLHGLDIAGDLEDEHLEATLLASLGQLKMEQGEFYVAQNYLEQALEDAEYMGDDALKSEVLEAWGHFHLLQGNLDEARVALEKGIEVASRLENAKLVCNLLLRLGNVYAHDGNFSAGLERYESCLRMAQEAGDRVLIGRALNNIGGAHATLGHYEKAMECYRRSIDVREGIGYVRGVIANYHNIGDLFFRQNRLGKAYTYFEQSMLLSQEYRWPLMESQNLMYMGYIEAAQGDESGLERLYAGQKMGAQVSQESSAILARYLEGLLAARRAIADGRSLLEEALQMAQGLSNKVLEEQVKRAIVDLDEKGEG